MRRPSVPPALVLLLLSPLVGELLSGSSPPAEYFSLPGFVILQLLYGCGAVLVRELRVRWRGGVGSMILLGCAYGVVEEGVMIASFFNPGWVDLGNLGVYGRWLGVNWVWAVGLTIYHAFVSITAPVLLVELAYPGRRGRPWLSGRWLGVVGALFAGDVVVGFFLFQAFLGYAYPITGILGALAAVALLVYAAMRLPPDLMRGGVKPPRRPRYFFAVGFLAALLSGVSFYILANQPGVPPLAVMALNVLTAALAVRHLAGFDWRLASPLHVFAVVAGSLSLFVPFDFIAELDKTRTDNTRGLALVGLVFAAGLLIMYRWLQRQKGERWGSQPVVPDAGTQDEEKGQGD